MPVETLETNAAHVDDDAGWLKQRCGFDALAARAECVRRLIESGVPPAAIIACDVRREHLEKTRSPIRMGGKTC